MKKFNSGAMHRMKEFYSQKFSTSFKFNLVACTLLFISVAMTSCQKEKLEATVEIEEALRSAESATVLSMYSNVPWQTGWELQQARSATARYRVFDNAIRDGYEDINVVVEEMGHHFLKATEVDAGFDPRKPEILVYEVDHAGNKKLVAVEYAIPLDLSVNAPTGFTGNLDVWKRDTFFQLWLLHAWVWEYNPLGVFNPTNPLVHSH